MDPPILLKLLISLWFVDADAKGMTSTSRAGSIVLADDFSELMSARARVGPEPCITIAEEYEAGGISAESRYGGVREAHNGRVSRP